MDAIPFARQVKSNLQQGYLSINDVDPEDTKKNEHEMKRARVLSTLFHKKSFYGEAGIFCRKCHRLLKVLLQLGDLRSGVTSYRVRL
jgi:hypothetical protein